MLVNEVLSEHNYGICYERTFIKMDDEGTISIDWAKPDEEPGGRRKVCVIFPSFSGGSQRQDIKNLASLLMKNGYEIAILHSRGFGNTEYTSSTIQNFSSNEEFIKGL